MCPSSGETTVFRRHLVLGTVWYAGYAPCIPDSHSHRITSTKCLMDTVVSAGDGHLVVRNM
jgi:hypothetical protein